MLEGQRLIRSRPIRIVALVLALIAGLACVLGYNFVFDKNIRPKVRTLDD
jgi:hypothetical protein